MANKKEAVKKKTYKKNNINVNGLTPKQQKFCDVFLKVRTASQAAREAGYAEKTCSQSANYFLKNPKIKAYLDKMDSKMQVSLEWDRNKHLEELMYQYQVVRDRHYKKEAREFLLDISKFLGLDAPEKKEVTFDTSDLTINIVKKNKK